MRTQVAVRVRRDGKGLSLIWNAPNSRVSSPAGLRRGQRMVFVGRQGAGVDGAAARNGRRSREKGSGHARPPGRAPQDRGDVSRICGRKAAARQFVKKTSQSGLRVSAAGRHLWRAHLQGMQSACPGLCPGVLYGLGATTVFAAGKAPLPPRSAGPRLSHMIRRKVRRRSRSSLEGCRQGHGLERARARRPGRRPCARGGRSTLEKALGGPGHKRRFSCQAGVGIAPGRLRRAQLGHRWRPAASGAA